MSSAPQKPSGNNDVNQEGKAGRDLIQIGRDYLQYIQVNINVGNWGIVAFNILIIIIVLYGLYGIANSALGVVNIFFNGTQEASETGEEELEPVSLPQIPENPFLSITFPQAACGDALPTEDSQYPVNLYPVFITYSDSNLDRVKEEFCQDALSKRRQSTNEEVIQVASFITIERANQFRDFMAGHFGNANVGEATTIRARRGSSTTTPSPLPNNSLRTVFDYIASDEITIECLPGNSGSVSYQELDVIIEVTCLSSNNGGIGTIKVINYSTNPVEISLNMPDGFPDLLLPDESREYAGSVPWALRDEWENRPEGYRFDIPLSIMPQTERYAPYQLTMTLGSYAPGEAIREVTVNCGDKPRTVWGLKITPQCVPPGFRAELMNMEPSPISFGFANSSDPPVYLEGQLFSGSSRSSSETVTFRLLK